MNTFGRIFRFTSFGESHGKAIGGVIDGCPPGIEVDYDFINEQLKRRRPGLSKITTLRKEPDEVEFLSGIFEGKTTGTPIAFVIYNRDQRSKDYESFRDIFRPSHGDYTYYVKYGNVDYRGGGRYSARETAVRVVAGSIAMLVLKRFGISVNAYVSQVGNIKLDVPYSELDLSLTYSNDVRCPEPSVAQQMYDLIHDVKTRGDTVGGVVTGIIRNLPAGLGEPVYDKFHARLSYAMMSINAARGFEIGEGFSAAAMYGSQHNDAFYVDKDGQIRTLTNHSGGVQAGITNGMDVVYRVAFKPVATIFKPQRTVTRDKKTVEFVYKGRHDPCVVPRAVPVVEAMAAVVTLDFLMLQRAGRL